MLGKLMKYDLRSMLRKFAPLWVAAAALSVVCGFSLRVLDKAASAGFPATLLVALLPMALFGFFVAMGVMTLIFVCSRYYRDLLGDEGYLMHTLPVTAGAHIASKGLTALILEIVSCLVALLCIFLVVLCFTPADFFKAGRELVTTLRQIDFPAVTPLLVAEGLLVAVAYTAAETLKIYAAISIGHLAKRRRALWAILAFVGISIVMNTLAAFDMSGGLLGHIFNGSWGLFADNGAITASGLGMMAAAMGAVLLWSVLPGALYFFVSRFILKKHLNLE